MIWIFHPISILRINCAALIQTVVWGGQSQYVHSGTCYNLPSVAVLQQHPATLTLVSESCFCKTTRCLLSGTRKHLLFKVFEQTANAVVFLARTVLLYLCTLLLYLDSMSLKHFLHTPSSYYIGQRWAYQTQMVDWRRLVDVRGNMMCYPITRTFPINEVSILCGWGNHQP